MRPRTLLAPLLLTALLAGCASSDEPPAEAAGVSVEPGADAPAAGPGQEAAGTMAGNASVPRVLSEKGAFLLAVGNPAGVGPQVVPQTRLQGSAPFAFEAQAGEDTLVVDFYYRSAMAMAFRAVDPEGHEEYGATADSEGVPTVDPDAWRHVQGRFSAVEGAWTLEPYAFQARASVDYAFVVSLFRGEVPEGYEAPMPE